MNLTFDSTASLSQSLSFGNIDVYLDMSDSSDVGSLGVGYSGSGSLTIRNGVTVVSSGGALGYASGSTGTAVVDGSGSTWNALGTSGLYVGDYGNGTLDITNGGAVNTDRTYVGWYGGTGTGTSNGTMTVDGAGSTFTSSYILGIGSEPGARGIVNITNGGSITTYDTYISGLSDPRDVGSAGTATVDGSGSTWTSTHYLRVGVADIGVLNVTNGGVINHTGSSAYLGYGGGGVGVATVDGSGSTWTNSGSLYVGYSGTGTLNVTGGAAVSDANGYLGYNAGSSGTATVDGSTFSSSELLYVGYKGDGTLNIANGSVVSAAGTTYVAAMSGSTGTIDFAGGTLTTKGLYVSPSQLTGTGTIEANGLVSDYAALTLDAATKTFTINDSVTVNLDVSDSSTAGDLGAGYWGNGSLTIQNGAAVYSAAGYLGYQASSAGTVSVDGGSTWTNAGPLYIGYGASSTGTLNIANGSAVSADGDVHVGYGDDSTATVNFGPGGGTLTANAMLYTTATALTGTGVINAKGLISDLNLTFDGSSTGVAAFGTGGVASVDMSDGTSELGIGYKETTAVATIQNGATVNSATGYVGYTADASGTMTVTGSGSTWNADEFHVGKSGAGTLNITGGGGVNSAGSVFIGTEWRDTSVGVVNVNGAGSTLVCGESLFVGNGEELVGSATLNVTNGAAVSNVNGYICGNEWNGGRMPSVATVSGAGSTWTNTGNLYMADNGEGTLNLNDNGTVLANEIIGCYDAWEEGNGVMTINFDGGILKSYNSDNSDWIWVWNGEGHIYVKEGGAKFDTNGRNMGILMDLEHGGSGTDGGLTKLGTGTLTLSGSNSYTGMTTVQEGKLAFAVSSAVAGSGVTVSGGTLDMGAISHSFGTVALQSGAHHRLRHTHEHQQLPGARRFGQHQTRRQRRFDQDWQRHRDSHGRQHLHRPDHRGRRRVGAWQLGAEPCAHGRRGRHPSRQDGLRLLGHSAGSCLAVER